MKRQTAHSQAEALRRLAADLHAASLRNLRAGMAPLVHSAMNPSAPYARTAAPGQPLQPILSSARPVALPPAPQPVDYRANEFGTFFYPGLAEEEIRKEREGHD